MTPVLRLRGLTLHRGSKIILENVSWDVFPGERWAILGPNGCGKTTLLNALTGYATPVDGEMSLFGETYGQTDWRELRRRVGLVSTSLLPRIDDNEKAWEIVLSGRYAQINFWGDRAPDDRARADEFLARVEAAPLAEAPWKQLSAGERQRVLIARALNAEPAILLLDEPCAHLDPVARERFLGFLDRLASDDKTIPVVLVTHHLEEVTPAFTHALLLKTGRVLAVGKTDEVLTEKNLSALFDVKLRIERIDGKRWVRVTT
jgi:iron complex transport system ATP-binding protein